MKKQIKKWTLRITATGMLIAILLLVIILNPVLSYAHATKHDNYTIFHNKSLDPVLKSRLDEATTLIQKSEWYDAGMRLDICLNEGSAYPFLIRIKGQAFAWGFYNKVVLQGTTDCSRNIVELNGYKWNLVQLLSHEMMHCVQYRRKGLWKSNPFAGIDEWKWEGYPEYIARQDASQKDLEKNVGRLIETEKTDHNNWIQFADSTGTVIQYYKYWLLVQYCMDIRKMSYDDILQDESSEEGIRAEMMDWYRRQK